MSLRLITGRLAFLSVSAKHQPASSTSRSVHITSRLCKAEDRRQMKASMPVKDEGTLGERTANIDEVLFKKVNIFPDAGTATRLFNGIPFNEIPICNVKVSPNNTIINITDHKGIPLLIRSCGVEGFKNTRKGTNIAAQATAISISTKAIERGIKNVRIQVQGIGPGRMSSIKGLQMGGLNIISVTDNTPVSWNPPRPRKAKRL